MELPTVPTAGDPAPVEAPAEILARIDAREREIEHALHEAHETAAAIVQQARDRAQALLAARGEQLARESAALGERTVAEARRVAEEVQAAGAREAAAIRAMPAQRVARAVEGLLALVLGGGSEGDGR